MTSRSWFSACMVPGLLLAGCGRSAQSPQSPGVSKDEARAAALFTRACDGGDATGCSMLKALRR